MNPHRHQHERVGDAIRSLMSLTMPAEDRIVGAMTQLHYAFRKSKPAGEAFEFYDRIMQIVGTGPVQARASRLSGDELYRLSTAFWELDRRIAKAYYTFEAPAR